MKISSRFSLITLASLALPLGWALTLSGHVPFKQLDRMPQSFFGPDQSCAFPDRCENGRNRFWAQEAVDSDLMKSFVSRIVRAPAPLVQVAVIDSGFDQSQEARFSSVGGVHTAAGSDIQDVDPVSGRPLINQWNDQSPEYRVGNPAIDQDGHGTMVTSLIAAKGSMGMIEGAHVSVYRITPAGSSGSTKDEMLDIAKYKACIQNQDSDGIVILNVSWGSRSEESGNMDAAALENEKKLRDFLAKNGCLVVRASGNSTFRNSQSDGLLSPELVVSSVDYFADLSTFSSSGQVSAPGSDIFVIESSQIPMGDRARPDQRCTKDDQEGSHLGRRINGTSFATPIVAGISAQVVRVLKSGSSFGKLSPLARVRLVAAVIRSSAINGSVNGLRAVKLASIWNQFSAEGGSLPGIESPGEFQATSDVLLSEFAKRPDSICSGLVNLCASQSCPVLRDCLSQARARLALCAKPNVSVIEDLAQTALSSGGVELSTRLNAWLKTLNVKDGNSISQSMIGNYIDRMGDSTQAQTRWDLNFVLDQLAPYFRECAKLRACNSNEVSNGLRGALISVSLNQSLYKGIDSATGEDRGSTRTLRALLDLITSSRTILGDNAVLDVLSENNDRIKKGLQKNREGYSLGDFYSSEAAGAARVYDSLIKSEAQTSAAFSQKIQSLERALLAAVSLRDTYYGKTTDQYVGFSEVYPNRSFFDGMVLRNRSLIDQAIESGRLDQLAPIQMQYLYSHMNEVPAWKANQKKIAFETLSRIGKGQGWGGDSQNAIRSNNSELIEGALVILSESSDLASAKSWLSQFVSQAQNTRLLVGFLLNYSFNRPLYGTLAQSMGISYSKLPLLDSSVMSALSRRLAASLVGKTAAQLRASLSDVNLQQGIFEIFKQLGLAQRDGGLAPIPRGVLSVDFSFKEVERSTSESKIASDSVESVAPLSNIPYSQDSIMVDRLAQWLLTSYLDGKERDAFEGVIRFVFRSSGSNFGSDNSLEAFLAGFPNGGRWLEPAREILARMNSGSLPLNERLAANLSEFVDRATHRTSRRR